MDFIYHVTCLFTGARLDDAACKCKKLESQDYPCAHIFCVLDHLGVRTFPKKIVKKRWTMHAKPAFPSSRTANTHVWSDHMNKYHQLRNMASDALFTAAASDSQSEQVMELLRSILVDGEKTDLDEGHKSFVPLPAYFSAARECCTDDVENPIKIVPKGRPTTEESNKRIKSRRERMRGKKATKLVHMFISLFISIHAYNVNMFSLFLQFTQEQIGEIKGHKEEEAKRERLRDRRRHRVRYIRRGRFKKSNEVSAHVNLIVHFHTCLQC